MSDIHESLKKIHEYVEQLAHSSKDIYARALRIHYSVSHEVSNDIWSERFVLHERAYAWAKKHMVPRKCSLWQIHETLLNSAKQQNRITKAGVQLSQEESEILDLSYTSVVPIWAILGKLPRFFL